MPSAGDGIPTSPVIPPGSPIHLPAEMDAGLSSPRAQALHFIRLALVDIQVSSQTPEALSDAMPGVLERKSLLTMTRLWDKESWKQHRAVIRWWQFIKNWPQSSILQNIRSPIAVLLMLTCAILLVNRMADLCGFGRVLQLPLAPLSLQSATVGLLVVSYEHTLNPHRATPHELPAASPSAAWCASERGCGSRGRSSATTRPTTGSKKRSAPSAGWARWRGRSCSC